MKNECRSGEARAVLKDVRRSFFREHGEPDFAPLNGHCWHCGFDLIDYYGIQWETEPITGCPSCHYSYCE